MKILTEEFTPLLKWLDTEYGDLFWNQDREFIPSVAELRKLYSALNEFLFGGELPSDMRLAVEELTNDIDARGVCGYVRGYDGKPSKKMIIKVYVEPSISMQMVIDTLAHEMVHAADRIFGPLSKKTTPKSYDPHGAWFMEQINRIADEGGIAVTKQSYKGKQRYFNDRNVWLNETDQERQAALNRMTPAHRKASIEGKKFFDSIKTDEFFSVEVDGEDIYVVIA